MHSFFSLLEHNSPQRIAFDTVQDEAIMIIFPKNLNHTWCSFQMLQLLKDLFLLEKSAHSFSCNVFPVDSDQLEFFVAQSVTNDTSFTRLVRLICNCLNEFVLCKTRSTKTLQINYRLQHVHHLLVLAKENLAVLPLN